jgi:hypothetical protein
MQPPLSAFGPTSDRAYLQKSRAQAILFRIRKSCAFPLMKRVTHVAWLNLQPNDSNVKTFTRPHDFPCVLSCL